MENNNEPLLYRWVKASENMPPIYKPQSARVTTEFDVFFDVCRFDGEDLYLLWNKQMRLYPTQIEWLEPYTPPVAPEAAPVKSAEEIIRERYPFYDPTINGKDVELCGEQVQKLMERYLEVNSSSTPVA